ncbi:MAG TPA: MFS transporter [Pseudonocardia sp.]
MLILPPLGALSDRIGRRPLLIFFAAGFVLLSVPLFAWLGSSGWSLFVVMTVGLALFAGYGSVGPVAMAELFPTAVRTAGIGLPYALTVAVFGGTARTWSPRSARPASAVCSPGTWRRPAWSAWRCTSPRGRPGASTW